MQKVTPDAFLKSIIAACYPSYRGRKVRLNEQRYPIDVRSYWDSGSRSYFVFYSLLTGTTVSVPTQSPYDKQVPGSERVTLPEGVLCVEHSIFMGKDSGITIHVHPDNLTRLLAQPQTACA